MYNIMDDVCEYTQERSEFWLKIRENDTAITISANEMTKNAITIRYPSLVRANARRGWKPSEKGSFDSLWIPRNFMDWYAYQDMEKMKAWAEIAGNQCIWLSTNANTQPFFKGTELNFCVAYDWSFDFSSDSRTDTGEAEYQMKYHFNELSEADKTEYADTLLQAIEGALLSLPYDYHVYNFIVTAIPATVLGQNKLAWDLAECAAKILDIDMIPLTLANEKPPIKNLPINEKVDTWRRILSNPYYFSPSEETRLSLRNRNVLIVDDLYQSGASIWCLAEHLKNNMGANIVQGATVVKAMKDSDNS